MNKKNAHRNLFHKVLFFATSMTGLTLSENSFANGTATTSQAAYWAELVDIFTTLTILVGALLALVVLTLTLVFAFKEVLKKDSMSNRSENKPMTFAKTLGGIVVATILYMPLHAMTFFGDLLGTVRSDSGSTLCLVANINVKHMTWSGNAQNCIEHVKKKAQEFAQYTEKDHLDSANLPLLFGVVQMLALIFFISAAWMLSKNILGYRDLKITSGMALTAMFASSLIMTLPNVVDYIQDVRGSNTYILDTTAE